MKDYKLTLAILTVVIVWGTTFLSIRIAVETIPAWFVAEIRQFLAAVIILCILLYRRQFQWIGWKNFGYQIIFSSLMLIVANGMTTLAEESVTSSLASLSAPGLRSSFFWEVWPSDYKSSASRL